MTCKFLSYSNIIIFHLSCLPKQMFIANVLVLCVKHDLMFQSLVESYLLQNYKCIFFPLNGRLTYNS